MFNWRKFFPLFAMAVFLLSPKNVLAQIVINEFSSYSDPEWVELYNNSFVQTFNLLGWIIADSNEQTGDDLVLNGDITPRGFRVFERKKGWLNNGGDIIFLKNSSSGSLESLVTYGDIDGSGVVAPKEGQSAGRSPDGIGAWVIFDEASRGGPNSIPPTAIPTLFLSNTPTPLPTSTPTTISIPTPTPAKATYQINEVKNGDGDILSSVKIYVDDKYIHHYVPETLEFCDGCYCDSDKEAKCGFGEHTIRLEKSNYQDWNEAKTINAGDFYTVDPVMVPLSTLTPTPALVTATIAPTIIPTNPTLTSSLKKESFSSWPTPHFVLQGYSLIKDAKTSLPSPRPQVLGEQSSSQKEIFPPLLFFSGGVFYIGLPIYRLKRKWGAIMKEDYYDNRLF